MHLAHKLVKFRVGVRIREVIPRKVAPLEMRVEIDWHCNVIDHNHSYKLVITEIKLNNMCSYFINHIVLHPIAVISAHIPQRDAWMVHELQRERTCSVPPPPPPTPTHPHPPTVPPSNSLSCLICFWDTIFLMKK